MGKMNVKRRLIWEFMLNDFELSHNAAEATQIFVVQKIKAQLITVQQ